MKNRNAFAKISLGISLLFLSAFSFGATKPDNTKVNERDRASNELTADQQKSNRPDSEITRRIRQDLVKQKELSTYAQNIKIITVNGIVTIKGPVRSQDEQSRVLSSARAVAGTANVVNETSIVPEETPEQTTK